MVDPLLEFRSVSIRIGGRTLFSDLSFSISRGERLSLVGPNGVGKTTLLRTLFGMTSIVSGEVFFEGVPVERISIRELTRRIGYLPQRVQHVPNLTVDEYFHSLRSLYGASFHNALSFESYGPRKLSTLSGGELQRVLFAGAVCHSPKLVLLDEPFTALDSHGKEMVEECISSLPEEVSVILVSHDSNVVESFSTRTISLDMGKGSVEEAVAYALT